jgi:UDP-N-acetylglucosamine 2-epimerase (hydrolysing)
MKSIKRKIAFLTGTRADFGKIKGLIKVLENSLFFEPYIFITGMHMMKEYGLTRLEVEKCRFKNISCFNNQTDESSMELTLAKTIEGFSEFVNSIKPDLIVVHGDRLEALAGAITGSFKNILVAHIEGGEVSGTIDELVRHSVSKLSHIHFTSNDTAKKRLVQMGEMKNSIFVIGSPDLDIMFSQDLPSLDIVKTYYEINFSEYSIFMFHPVTTEIDKLEYQINQILDALIESNKHYIVIFPNNDFGSKIIIRAFKRLLDNSNFKIFPSVRFEYFLTFLKNATTIIGNSSAGIREAPYYGIPTLNIGTRQNNRFNNSSITNCKPIKSEILTAIHNIEPSFSAEKSAFGKGNSSKFFIESLMKKSSGILSSSKN